MTFDVDLLLAWCLNNIECDGCRALGATYEPKLGTFICEADRQLIARFTQQPLPDDEGGSWQSS